MKNKFLLIILIWTNLLFSKEVLIKGKIVNQDNNKAIPYVNISVKGSFKGTYSDLNGNFKINLPAGAYIFEFYHVSFYDKTIRITTGNKDSLFVIVRLKEKTEQLGVITVEAPKEETLTHYTLNIASIQNLPAVGEPDIIRTIGMLPGIQITNDYKIQPSVQGGNPDQTEYILDGIEIYYPQHLRGIFSAFNLWAIDHVNVYTTNFPPEFYGKLSGIIEIFTPKGNFISDHNTNFHKTYANISLLSTSIATQWQMQNNFFALSARRTYLDYIFSLFKYKIPYYFYDMNFKWQHKFNSKWLSTVLFFKDRDNVKFNSSNLHWGNEVIKVELNYRGNFFRHKFFLANSEFFTNSADKEKINKLNNRIKNFIIRYRIKKIFPKNISEIGAEFKRTLISHSWKLDNTLNPSKLFYEGAPNKFNKRQTANLYRTYFYNSLILKNDKVLLDTKLDAIIYDSRKSYTSAGIELNYKYNDRNRFYFAADKQYQFIAAGAQGIEWSINSPLFLLNDAMNVFRITFGLSAEIVSGISAKVELYDKKYSKIVRLNKSGTNFPDFEYGKGQAYGADFLFSKKEGRITFQVGYSLNQSYVNFNREKYFPDWYIPNSFKSIIGFRFGKTWLLSASTIYRSGLLYSKPVKSFFSAGENSDYEYGNFDYNRLSEYFILNDEPTSRFAPYFRLDLSLKKEYQSKYFKWYLYLQVFNVTNHINPLRVNWSRFYANGGHSKTRGYELNMPIIPTIGAEFIFK